MGLLLSCHESMQIKYIVEGEWVLENYCCCCNCLILWASQSNVSNHKAESSWAFLRLLRRLLGCFVVGGRFKILFLFYVCFYFSLCLSVSAPTCVCECVCVHAYMWACICMLPTYVQLPAEAKNNVICPEARVTDSCEPPKNGTGNITWVLWKKNKGF